MCSSDLHHRHHHHLHHRRMGRQRLAHQHQPHNNNPQHHHNQHLHHHPHHHPTHPRHLRARNNDAPRVPHHDRESRPPVGREQVAARGIRSAARFRGRPVRSCPCPSCPFPFRCSALGTIPDFPALGAVPHWRARRRPDPNAARAGLLGAWNRRPRWPGRPLRPRAHGNVLEPVATGSGRSSCRTGPHRSQHRGRALRRQQRQHCDHPPPTSKVMIARSATAW